MGNIISAVNDTRKMVEPNTELHNKLSSMFGFGNAFYSHTKDLDKISNFPLAKNLELIIEQNNLSSAFNNQLGWMKSLNLENNNAFGNQLEWIKSLQPLSDTQKNDFLNRMGIFPFPQNNNLGNYLNINSDLLKFVGAVKTNFSFDESIEWEERFDLMERAIDETLYNQEDVDLPATEQIISVIRKVFNILTDTDKNVVLTNEELKALKYAIAFLPIISIFFPDKVYVDTFLKFYIMLLSFVGIANDNKNK